MLDPIPLTFEHPAWLLLLVLLVPIFLLSRRSIGGMSAQKTYITFLLRSAVVILLTAVLAQPSWVKRGEGVTVTVLLDRSQSIPLPLKRTSLEFIKDAARNDEGREDEDRVAVISIARDAAIAAMPDRFTEVTAGQDVADATATNLAGGVRTALAIMPDDTANRILLASDGNETIDSVLQAAELAKANNVPIDVLLLEYEHESEVIFERISAPARARLGQSANIKLVLRSQAQTSGSIYLSMNGERVDLNGEGAGDGLAVELEPGLRVLPVTISMDQSGPIEYEAVFEPDDPRTDYISNNNQANAVTFVAGEGRVLIVDDGSSESKYLYEALVQSEIEVERVGPGAMTGLVMLSGYDAVILANIPRYSFDDEQDRMLHAYVHDLGGGLIMLGGPNSFGAGGWNDSELARVLPVRLDPPQSRQMPRGALALIMHSCEMPQGNYWGQKVAESAINTLSRLDYVGIVEYNWNAGNAGFGGANWALPMQEAGDKSVALQATKKMVVGDMPDFGSCMTLALQGLTSVRAGQKHAIIISDGDPAAPSNALLNQYVQGSVTVTTIMVGGHGTAMHRSQMQAVANRTGGRFYNITNPKQLPQIFIKEAQLVSRSLIQEGDFRPQFANRLPGPIDAFDSVPAVSGYVLTAPREGLVQTPLVINTSEGADPFYAYWNYGLGRSVAFTSDATGRWAQLWASWSEFREFWEQSVRWVMRPSSPRNMQVQTKVEGDTAVVELEALEGDASFVNFMSTRAAVIGPNGEADPLSLTQVGPGRYRGQFDIDDAGSYLVNISYAAADGSSPGHMQAAVSVPYSDEFRAIKHNRALLADLAERTNGRMINASDELLADLFNREELEVPKTPKAIWDLLTIIAAALFLFDVAARRLTIDPKWLAGLAQRAARKQKEASMETVAAWKRTRSQVEAQREERASRLKSEDRTVRKARFEASEADAASSINVGAETPGDVDAKKGKVDRKPQQPKPDADQDAGDYTSRLLKAKRRARNEDESQNDEGGSTNG